MQYILYHQPIRHGPIDICEEDEVSRYCTLHSTQPTLHCLLCSYSTFDLIVPETQGARKLEELHTTTFFPDIIRERRPEDAGGLKQKHWWNVDLSTDPDLRDY